MNTDIHRNELSTPYTTAQNIRTLAEELQRRAAWVSELLDTWSRRNSAQLRAEAKDHFIGETMALEIGSEDLLAAIEALREQWWSTQQSRTEAIESPVVESA